MERKGKNPMMTVNVILTGRLRIDGYGKGHTTNGDGSMQLALQEGGTVCDVIASMNVPSEMVAMAMVNGRRCLNGTPLNANDRVVLIPPDVACFWRMLGIQNMGMDSVFDF